MQADPGSALREWKKLLGEDRVLDENGALERYGPPTEGASRKTAGALLLKSTDEVVHAVRIASRHGIPLYPISTGCNWGYGSAVPPRENCVIADLSGMNKILGFDAELGLAEIEPGVSQEQLYRYLIQKRLPYLLTINGGGKDASLFGNVLERGFENLPYMERFESLVSLEAVLPNGEIYSRNFPDFFRWGVGPYLDGLFSQGSFGIVTRMTMALFHLPERIDSFSFRIPDDRSLGKFVVSFRKLRESLGAMVGLLRIVNTQRLLAGISFPYPHDRVKKGKAVSEEEMDAIRKEHNLPPWIGACSLLGSEKVVAAARRIATAALSTSTSNLRFVTERFPYHVSKKGEAEVSVTQPRDDGLVEAYWKIGRNGKRKMSPGRDGCGIIWYPPIVPLTPDWAFNYIALVNRICRKHGIDSEASLIAASEHFFYGITPLVFNRDDDEETRRVHRCYEELYREGRKAGLHPYRMPSQFMNLAVEPSNPFWRFAEKLKKAVDPGKVFSPGRYSI